VSGRDTSLAAADEIAERAPVLRDLVLLAIRHSDVGLTADEAAAAIGISILSIRPRVSELAKLAEITDSGDRRRNQSGKLAIVWREAWTAQDLFGHKIRS
jgi:hypothetical protein